MPRTQGLHPNLSAFLDVLAWAEGTSTNKNTQDDGYDIEINGNRFTDYSTHPFDGRDAVKVKVGLHSTAAGRYQFLIKYWHHYRDLLKLPDFGPLSQDRWAIHSIREQGALLPIKQGFLDIAVSNCRNIWASLPGAGYGQPERSLDKLCEKFLKFGGRIAQ